MTSSPLGPRDVDAAFADIVARLESERGDGGPGREDRVEQPAVDADETPDETGPADGTYPTGLVTPSSAVPWRVDPTGSVEKALLSDDEELFGESDDDAFVPAPTAQLPPASDRTFWVALVGLVLGPVLLLVALVGRDSLSSWWAWSGIALLVVGFGALVARLPGERHDDGARV